MEKYIESVVIKFGNKTINDYFECGLITTGTFRQLMVKDSLINTEMDYLEMEGVNLVKKRCKCFYVMSADTILHSLVLTDCFDYTLKESVRILMRLSKHTKPEVIEDDFNKKLFVNGYYVGLDYKD